MPFEAGHEKVGGRQRGTQNAATADGRAAIAAFVDGNAERLNGLLDRIAEDDPKAAFDCIMSVVEYHIPKLARYETKTQITHLTLVALVEKSYQVDKPLQIVHEQDLEVPQDS